MPADRRLAAILFTDIVGSTAVRARSESAGLALRDRHGAENRLGNRGLEKTRRDF
jgi:class 3 adenylate cyclase